MRRAFSFCAGRPYCGKPGSDPDEAGSDPEQRGLTPAAAEQRKASFEEPRHAVRNATPDGYTILMVSTSWVMNAAVRSSLPYDVEKSFDPIVTIGTSRDLVERAKAYRAKIFYASTGVAGFNPF